MSQVFSAKVKNVLSGDTVILVPSKSTQFPLPERMLTLSYVRSGDSVESKEMVRKLLIGKEIKFKVLFKHPSTGKEFGDIQSPIFKSLIEYLVERGVVKLKENINEESDFVDNLQDLEQKARSKEEGLWDSNTKPAEEVELTPEIIAKSVKTPLVAVVEKVISGDRVVCRINVSKNKFTQTPLLLAGIKSPRTDDTQSKLLATVAQQAKSYVEDKILTTTATLHVKIIGENQSGLPVAIFEHSSGNNIHEKMLENGFAEIVDWQSTLVGSSTMALFRKAEQTAKALGKGMYATGKSSTTSLGKVEGKITTKHLRPGLTINNATVAKVVQADTLVIRLPSNEEVTFQLASLRGPKRNDATITSNKLIQEAIVNSAREYVRHLAASKPCTVYIDGFRKANPDLGMEARFLVSVKINNKDISETIVENGWATVIKHNKQTSDERSLNWDKLVELEEEQKKASKKGIYFKGDISKILTVGTRIIDISENATKARSFFGGLKQKGRISGQYHVEYIPSVNRVRLFNPKEGTKLSLILGGLANKKTEGSEDGLKYMNTKYLQKNVDFEIYDMDKIGGFIGNLYANPSALEPVQVQLLEQGFAKVHDIAVGSNKFEAAFDKAEDAAKSTKKGLWAHEQVEEITSKVQNISVEVKPIFSDISVTYIDDTGILFYQDLNSSVKDKFNLFKQEFDEFHAQIPSATAASSDLPFNLNKAPKKGEHVSVKLEENGKYYRGKVLGYEKSTGLYEVKHIDYGNIDHVSLSSLRALPSFYSVVAIPPFCKSCKLRFIKMAPTKPIDYLSDSLDLLDQLTLEKTLVISALPSKTTGVDYDVILYDSEESLKDPSYTINKKLVTEGLAIVDETQKSEDKLFEQLQLAQRTAITNHKGCWEYGEVSFEDEEDL